MVVCPLLVAMETSLTKIDVARRQLRTAIQLLFDGGDPVSIYSLAANAWEVIDVLCKRAVIKSFSSQAREHVPAGNDLKYDYVNPYRNFFKHADRDPDAVLAMFDESAVDSVIFLAVEDYLRLLNKAPIEFQVFQAWYLASNVEKVAADALDEIVQALETTFPDIRQHPRKDRIVMWRRVLMDALRDDELSRDDRTENAN